MSADPKPKKKNQNVQNYIRDLDTYGYVKIENFLNKVGTKLNTKKFTTDSNYRKKISNALSTSGGDE